jgi:glutamate synthase (NADPH/NADH) small chain
LREYHAIVLAGGSTIPRDLDIPGRNLKGIHFAMEFLKQNNKKVAGKSSINAALNEIMVEDKKVVVIGGGDTGSDCVGTANRLNAASVLQFELLPKPPVERNNSMPWPTYPMLLKTTSSHEEGVERHWAIATKEFIGNDKGELVALCVTDLKWENNNGRPQFTEVEGSSRQIPCDRAFLALGFLHPEHESLISDLEVELDERGNVKTGKNDYQTNIPKIFSAGDMRRGQSLVVWAIKEGRDCAERVCQFLLPRE